MDNIDTKCCKIVFKIDIFSVILASFFHILIHRAGNKKSRNCNYQNYGLFGNIFQIKNRKVACFFKENVMVKEIEHRAADPSFVCHTKTSHLVHRSGTNKSGLIFEIIFREHIKSNFLL